MFVLQKHPQWIWPVIVRVPNEGGSYTPHHFRARFRLVSIERLAAFGETLTGTTDVLRDAVLEVMDVSAEDGAALPHSPELLEALLTNPWTRAALIQSYLGAISGAPPTPAAAGN
jgi:hypothetical protein